MTWLKNYELLTSQFYRIQHKWVLIHMPQCFRIWFLFRGDILIESLRMLTLRKTEIVFENISCLLLQIGTQMRSWHKASKKVGKILTILSHLTCSCWTACVDPNSTGIQTKCANNDEKKKVFFLNNKKSIYNAKWIPLSYCIKTNLDLIILRFRLRQCCVSGFAWIRNIWSDSDPPLYLQSTSLCQNVYENYETCILNRLGFPVKEY